MDKFDKESYIYVLYIAMGSLATAQITANEFN